MKLHDVFFQRSHVWICGQTRSSQNGCCWGTVYGQTFWIKTLKWPHSNPSLDWSWDQVCEGDGLVDDSCKNLAKNHWIPLSFGQNCLDPYYFPILNPHQSISRTVQHIPMSRPLEAESTVQRISAVRPLFRAAAAGTATMPEVAAKSMTGGWRV